MRNPFRRNIDPFKPAIEQRPEDVEVGGLGGWIKKVWSAPADYNREQRRSARLWGRLWRWDPMLLGIDPNLPPRYARRHWDPVKFAAPKTRRQRKVRARILRLMESRS